MCLANWILLHKKKWYYTIAKSSVDARMKDLASAMKDQHQRALQFSIDCCANCQISFDFSEGRTCHEKYLAEGQKRGTVALLCMKQNINTLEQAQHRSTTEDLIGCIHRDPLRIQVNRFRQKLVPNWATRKLEGRTANTASPANSSWPRTEPVPPSEQVKTKSTQLATWKRTIQMVVRVEVLSQNMGLPALPSFAVPWFRSLIQELLCVCDSSTYTFFPRATFLGPKNPISLRVGIACERRLVFPWKNEASKSSPKKLSPFSGLCCHV